MTEYQLTEGQKLRNKITSLYNSNEELYKLRENILRSTPKEKISISVKGGRWIEMKSAIGDLNWHGINKEFILKSVDDQIKFNQRECEELVKQFKQL